MLKARRAREFLDYNGIIYLHIFSVMQKSSVTECESELRIDKDLNIFLSLTKIQTDFFLLMEF